MTGRLLRQYLRDRLGLIALVYVNTAVVLLLVTLIFSFDGPAGVTTWVDAGYAALLTTTLLCIYLAVDLARWWPFARQARELLEQESPLDALGNLPQGANAEQSAARALALKLHSRFLAEQLRTRENHRRHLAFIHLWVHQMKTPVSAISLIAQQAETAEPSELRPALDSVEEEAGKLAEGLDLVLNMARLEEFARDYHVRRVDLLQSIRQVVNGRKKQFIRLGIFPEVEAATGEWTVLTDEKWNRFAIDQVVANALKYGAQAGPTSQRLTLSLERQDRAVVLSIADQGPGIPEADLPRVFEPFFTGENGRRFGGATGIGLWLVRQVMDRLDHSITIHSATGCGTTVTIRYRLTTS